MASQKHLAILKQGVEVWNQWRREHPIQRRVPYIKYKRSLHELYKGHPELSGANLSNANLRGALLFTADLRGANLDNADLSHADLQIAHLKNADLIGANLDNADLRDAHLESADLSYAHLNGADLRGAHLNGADLRNADLRGTRLNGVHLYSTIFANVDLHSVKGLVEVNHEGPSIVQLHTVQLPKDGSSVHFLRGTGLPDEWIDFYRASLMRPIVYHSCFISYSSKNEDFAKRLYSDLQSEGVRCWFAPEDLKIGDKIRTGIDEAIRIHDKLLLVLSENSVGSAWVEKEVETAFDKETKTHNLVLFPVRLDDAVMETDQAWAADIRRQRHIGDFTCWKNHDDYRKAFDRLLRDLKAEAQKMG